MELVNDFLRRAYIWGLIFLVGLFSNHKKKIRTLFKRSYSFLRPCLCCYRARIWTNWLFSCWMLLWKINYFLDWNSFSKCSWKSNPDQLNGSNIYDNPRYYFIYTCPQKRQIRCTRVSIFLFGVEVCYRIL